MGKIGGSKITKRSVAPAFWKIPRKKYSFTVTTSPGPHPKNTSYPLAVLIRDVLKLVKTFRETKVVMQEEKIVVDGIVRKNPSFPIGLMDVIEISSIDKSYRMVPLTTSNLQPIVIPSNEKSLKICKVTKKTTVKGGITQIGLHDGRSILFKESTDLNCGDSCLIKVPSQEIVEKVRLSPGAISIVIGGSRVGEIGKIKEIKSGTFSSHPMVKIELENDIVELPRRFVLAVGSTSPLITIKPT